MHFENVVSCFDGMSCGQLALLRAGHTYKNYYAYEIDKYSIKVTQHNFPNTIQLGNIENAKGCELPKIDLFIGGSPCQGFSFAGKQLAFDDPRSKLFFEYYRLYKECKAINPNILFLLENVCMAEESENVISKFMEVNPILINSALVSAQNRERLYWTNINCKPVGLFGFLEPQITQPKDKKIKIIDILETEVNEKYYLSNRLKKYITDLRRFNKYTFIDGEKSATLTTSYRKSGGGNYVSEFINNEAYGVLKFERNDEAKKERSNNLKNGKDYNKFNSKQIKEIDFEKSNCVTTYPESNIVIKIDRKGNIKNQQDKASALTVGGHGAGSHSDMDVLFIANYEGIKIRRFTPVEVERLQTVPDNYTNYVSDTQRYTMLGNGWNVDTIAHIFSFI